MDGKELGSMPIGTVQGQAYLHPDTGLPKDPYGYGWAVDPQPGITLRQHFAGLAMQGLLACGQAHDESTTSVTARAAIKLADAMLEELAKET